jgi:hypothetical protein
MGAGIEGCQQYTNFHSVYGGFQQSRNAPPKQRCPPTRQDMHMGKLARIGIGSPEASNTPPNHSKLTPVHTGSNLPGEP